MTRPASGDQKQAADTRAVRMGGWLVGMGVLHFVAPKRFDTIVPTELPGSARFYTHGTSEEVQVLDLDEGGFGSTVPIAHPYLN